VSSPELVADFDLEGLALAELPSGKALVAAARELGMDRVTLDVHASADGWAIVHPGPRVALIAGGEQDVDDLDLSDSGKVAVTGGGLCTLEETLLSAHRAKLGLVLRLRSARAIVPVSAALGVMGGEGPQALRSRFLVIAGNQRMGRRLRTDAPDLPSALELTPGERGLKAALRRRMPNLARAGADTDDVVVPWGMLADRDVPGLAKTLAGRGARLWVSDVTQARKGQAMSLPAAGLLLRLLLPG